MQSIRYHLNTILLIFLSIIGTCSYAAEVNDIRMWHAPERSRIVFDIDKEATFNVFTLSNPDRVVVDLSNTSLEQAKLPQPQEMGQFIEQVRLGYPETGVLRLVFDLKQPVRYFVQMLKPVQGYQYRLVVDYYHRDATDSNSTQITQQRPPPKVDITPNVAEPNNTPRKRKDKIVVIIDAGHGGEDPGAVGRRSHEKNVVLQISKQLQSELNRQPGVEAHLTRTGDYYIPLRRRILMARQKSADLFISVHADAFTSSRARGASVYALSQGGATSERARWLANKENASDLAGGVKIDDKDDLLADVLLDLSMSKTISESIIFGNNVLKELGAIGRLHSKRVEQAGFVVLKSPDIPSILIETAYISNPTEEKLLNSSGHQKKLAQAITSGVMTYLKKRENYYVN